MAEKRGEVPDAFMHPQLGNIALIYGDNDKGLAHIAAQRTDAFLANIPRITTSRAS